MVGLWSASCGFELGVAVQKMLGNGKRLVVDSKILEHCYDLSREQEEQVRAFTTPWKRKIRSDKDVKDFVKHLSHLDEVIFEMCEGRTFYFEGFKIKEEENEVHIEFSWGS